MRVKEGTIHIKRLGAESGADQLDGVDVVWVAKKPNVGSVVIGWYRKATVYREGCETSEDWPHRSRWGCEQYWARAREEDCVLLGEDDRLLKVPHGLGGFGEAPVWYADGPSVDQDFIVKVRRMLSEEHPPSILPDQLIPEELPSGQVYPEGARTPIIVNSYERSPKARAACIAHFGYRCSVCDVLLEEVFGTIAAKFIHVHHKVPLAGIPSDYKVNPSEDMRPVCPNCHAIIHRRNPPLSVEAARQLLQEKGREKLVQ